MFALPAELTNPGCGATASMAYRMSTSPRCCRSSTSARRAGRPLSSTSATARACVRSRPARASRAPWVSPPSTGCPWAPAAARSTPACALPHGRPQDGRPRPRAAALSPVGAAWRVRPLQRHARAPGLERAHARLAIDLYCYRIGREIGSLAAALGGLDALVFTGGIGANAVAIREQVCRDAAWLGVELDPAANAARGPRISTPGAEPRRGRFRPTRN